MDDNSQILEEQREEYNSETPPRQVEPAAQTRKRPWPIWVILIVYGFSFVWNILSFITIYGRVIPLNEAQLAHFGGQTRFDLLLAFSVLGLNMAGAAALFFLRRWAYALFLCAFWLALGVTIYQAVFKNWLGVLSGPVILSNIIGVGISLAVIFYTGRLKKKGII